MPTSKDIAVTIVEFIINDCSERVRGMDSCLNELLEDYERTKAREETEGPPPISPPKPRKKATKKWVGRQK